jgi:hypothetical protein
VAALSAGTADDINRNKSQFVGTKNIKETHFSEPLLTRDMVSSKEGSGREGSDP